MHQSSRRRVINCLALGLLFTILLTACRVEQAPNVPGVETSVPQSTNPTPKEATQTPVSQQGGSESSPTEASGTIPATPTRSAVDLTLTLVHTGQVLGEIDPCG
jgi:hypothetical protein